MKINYLLIAIILFSVSCKKKGCTNQEAYNYSTEAKKDDGSCIYLKKGCTDYYANNYDAEAKISDGSCTYTTNSVIIALDHFIDNDRLVLDDIRYTNQANNNFSITRLKYIVSNFKLHRPDGTSETFDIAHIRDLDVDNSRFIYLENVPDGYYNGLTFTYGLNTAQNITNAYSSTSEFQSMDWPEMMGGGYHHMKMEGKFYDSLGVVSFFNTHTGVSSSNNNDLSIAIDNVSFTMNKSIWEIQLKMNVNEWYKAPNTYDFNYFTNGIMGVDSAQVLIRENGADIWSLGYEIQK